MVCHQSIDFTDAKGNSSQIYGSGVPAYECSPLDELVGSLVSPKVDLLHAS